MDSLSPNSFLALLVTLGLVSTSSGQAQILGSLYASGSDTPADAQAFIDAGVTGISNSNAVTVSISVVPPLILREA